MLFRQKRVATFKVAIAADCDAAILQSKLNSEDVVFLRVREKGFPRSARENQVGFKSYRYNNKSPHFYRFNDNKKRQYNNIFRYLEVLFTSYRQINTMLSLTIKSEVLNDEVPNYNVSSRSNAHRV